MEQPKKEKTKLTVKVYDPDKVQFTEKELIARKKVQADNKTEAKAKAVSKERGLNLDTKTGTMTPRAYEKKLIKAKPGTGKESMIIDGGGKVLSKARPESKEHDEMVRKYKSDSTATMKSRKTNAELNEIQMDRGTNTNEFKKKVIAAENTEKYKQKNNRG